MGNYVSIKTSIGDLLTSASALRSQGKALSDRMKPLLADIANRDKPATFPPDEFSTPFTANYYKPIKAADGSMQPRNEAVRTSAAGVGEAMSSIGDYVTQAMWAYRSADDDNATGIASAGGG